MVDEKCCYNCDWEVWWKFINFELDDVHLFRKQNRMEEDGDKFGGRRKMLL